MSVSLVPHSVSIIPLALQYVISFKRRSASSYPSLNLRLFILLTLPLRPLVLCRALCPDCYCCWFCWQVLRSILTALPCPLIALALLKLLRAKEMLRPVGKICNPALIITTSKFGRGHYFLTWLLQKRCN